MRLYHDIVALMSFLVGTQLYNYTPYRILSYHFHKLNSDWALSLRPMSLQNAAFKFWYPFNLNWLEESESITKPLILSIFR